MGYHRVRVISGKGSSAEQFTEALRGIAVDPAGLLYAVGDREVKVFDLQGKLLRRWSTEKSGYCVAIDQGGTVHVGEVGQVEKFDPAGKRVAVWEDGDRLGVVTAIGFRDDFIFVADAKARVIRRYDKSGQWLNDIGKGGKLRGFMIPNGHLDFAVDSGGVIHAANPAKHRVERYSAEGELLGHFGRFGGRKLEDFPGCCNPTNLTLGVQGQVVVTEKAGPRVKVYDSDGQLLAVVASKEFDPNCKNMDVAVDSQGQIYVVDTVRLNIHVFAPVGAGV